MIFRDSLQPSSRSIRRVLTGCFILAGLLLAVPASGAPNSGLTYPALEKAVPDSGPDHLGKTGDSMGCHGKPPTGGGVQISGNNTDFDLEVATTETLGSRWSAEVNNDSGAPARMILTVVCANGGGRFSYPDASRTIPAGSQVLKKVSCPRGTQVVGGGVSTTGESTGIEIASSEPADGPDHDSKLDDAWLGTANNGTTASAQMGVVAVCAASGHYRYVMSAPADLPNNSVNTAHAHCPAGSHVTGGGIDVTGVDIGIEVAGTFPEDRDDADAIPDDGWVAVANNDNSGRDEQVRAFAICKT